MHLWDPQVSKWSNCPLLCILASGAAHHTPLSICNHSFLFVWSSGWSEPTEGEGGIAKVLNWVDAARADTTCLLVSGWQSQSPVNPFEDADADLCFSMLTSDFGFYWQRKVYVPSRQSEPLPFLVTEENHPFFWTPFWLTKVTSCTDGRLAMDHFVIHVSALGFAHNCKTIKPSAVADSAETMFHWNILVKQTFCCETVKF